MIVYKPLKSEVRRMNGWTIGLLASGLLWAGTVGSTTVQLSAGKLTVQASNTALQEVLDSIAKQAKFEVAMVGGSKLGQALVSEDFRELPLEEGLARLLSDWNYALVTDEANGELRKIFILSAREVSASPPVSLSSTQALPEPALPQNNSQTTEEVAQTTADVPTVEILTAQLASQNPPMQISALQVMRDQAVNDPALLAEVRRLAAEPSAEVQQVALGILILYDTSEEAKQVLRSLAEQPDGVHRDFATLHLNRMDDEAAAAAASEQNAIDQTGSLNQ